MERNILINQNPVIQSIIGFLAILMCVITMSSSVYAAEIMRLTEGTRDKVTGTTRIAGTDASNSYPGFDLTGEFSDNSFDGDDSLELFGRIVGAKDVYAFNANVPFTISLIDDIDENGFRAESSGDMNRSNFSLSDGSTTNSLNLDTPTAAQLLFSANAGSYTFSIHGDGDPAYYDVAFAPQARPADIPVPGTLGLLGLGLVGLGAMAQRRSRA